MDCKKLLQHTIQQKKRQGIITNWVNTTIEYLDELWVARDILSLKPEDRPRTSTGQFCPMDKTWDSYCSDLSKNRRTV